MARNDVFLNINALSPADAVVTGQQDMTAATVPELVLGDTPTFNFYFTDNTNVWPSWAGNAAYTVTWALSDAVSGDFSPAATTGNATPITGGWSIVLPLNAYDLVGLLNTKRVSQPYPVTNLWQQIRVADPSGNEITRAMFWTPIRYRAISDTQNTESASPTGGRSVTVDYVNALTSPTAAQFYAANPVPTSALGSAANGELLIGNGTGFTKATLTAGSGVSITNGSGSITISATDGDITLDDGTAAAPSLKFTADTDTGIYRPSDNVVGISAGGVSRATFGATSAINGTTIPGSKTLVVTTDKLSALAATTSAELAGVISDETGSGALVFATSPTLTTPILGTPQSGTLSSCTGLPISTGVSGLGTNVATALGTAVGSAGAFVVNGGALGTPSSGTLTNATGLPVSSGISGLGTNVATALAVAVGSAGAVVVNGGALGTPSSGTLTNATGLPISTGVSGLGTGVATFLATPSSANLASAVTDETGTGALVFANTPTLVTPNIGAATGTSVNLSGAGTFGGNLTVSARITANNGFTATSTVPTVVAASTNLDYNSVGAKGRLFVWGPDAGTVAGFELNLANSTNSSLINALSFASSGNATFAGNLTVSGTTIGLGGTPSAWSVVRAMQVENAAFAADGTTAHTLGNAFYDGSNWKRIAATSAVWYQATAAAGSHIWYNAGSSTAGSTISWTQAMTLNSSGNLLIGTTTDSANGKLQLATHTTSAGGIGFGTDVALYRRAANSLAAQSGSTEVLSLENTTAAGNIDFYYIINGTKKGTLTYDSSVDSFIFYLGSNNVAQFSKTGSILLRPNGTTALTLDSSQNATFAGRGQFSAQVTISKTDAPALLLRKTAATAVDWYLQYNTDGVELYGGTTPAAYFRVLDTGNATFAGKITANGAGSTFKGTATNDSAAAGYVGEFVSSTVTAGSPTSLTSGTPASITSVSLTAGDWDVSGNIGFAPNGSTTITYVAGQANTTVATEEGGRFMQNYNGITSAVYPEQTIPSRRVSISTTTTVYLVAQSSFGVSTMAAYGTIRARRVR